ncbi:DNA mismatch repair endonuclease MutL [Bacillus cytotoxicus]|uniref:DNA mismatch repair protein MutL n=1 Tax=Bacillus cytotoxicus (strain DSM 22905 / CIP 110041 / 391-98 / NVH 391-98) TaxID=315749 RepID=MUTL_BACCN|nr:MULTISPECIES: DNA mismatch repair endonuclease MutL [Bacillus cereus group]A7GR98.1 RecName: Full=DNA mismatch repair protein MutL [Bacillus cytotoxicus NVH 391-98]ABS22656.1 DNA mismatch repair protein MutL [Bacillus cytotoxicus NVH 391-98]AWC29327.1 DNA mismatch repair protein MutL [Bacillus cytotoxicus]AWC33334.1 DNA mismatch repair protein MutL [Bacillus cytotoxicus]AWC37313.1 DNA mismatch repair protein MutL [Bacillus cytotoxicus]AWC41453.1 DNA mismatch repair protein MutL [Bacillus c
MGKIRKLDEQLSNLIAAGEVVERPASVVKELVENSIDANSTSIEIHLEEAGLSKIRIIDNGDGIAEEDCIVAFERHATSKIKDENDLFRIRTLGFRGEALPSIASVSELELVTSTGDAPGTHLIIKGGEIIKQEKTASRKGTDITVQNLFFNTPARLKYMKTIHTELGNITDIVYRIAMSHPEVSLKLFHNTKKLLHTSGNGDVRQVLAAIYSIQVAKKLIPIEAESLDFTIRGYVTLPEVTRASRNYMSTIVNGRYVRNYVLMKAIQQGYHTLLPVGRYPIGFLSIEMDPMLVDVNVHPAKLEVRFSKEQELLQFIEQTLQDAFKKVQLIPDAGVTTKKKTKDESVQEQFHFEHTKPKEPSMPNIVLPTGMDEAQEEESAEKPSVAPQLWQQPKQEWQPPQSLVREEESWQSTSKPLIEEKAAHNEQEWDHHEEEFELEELDELQNIEEIEMNGNDLPPLYPIGQMHGTYIFAQNDKGLYMIDQHAAQERINYEYFRDKVGQVTQEVQELLVPYRIDLSLNEFLRVEEQLEELKKVGLFLEQFGHQSFIVRSHPIWFPKGKETEIIDEMMQQVVKLKKVDIKKLREEAAIMMSCKASIKANQYLTNDQIFALLEELRTTSNPYTCPHGRPIIIHHSTYELEKMFKRVM